VYLNWTVLGVSGLDYIGCIWTGLYRMYLDWTISGVSGLDCIGCIWTELYRMYLDCSPAVTGSAIGYSAPRSASSAELQGGQRQFAAGNMATWQHGDALPRCHVAMQWMSCVHRQSELCIYIPPRQPIRQSTHACISGVHSSPCIHSNSY
jgi:hypothetical protein